jgi:hypothetical protein
MLGQGSTEEDEKAAEVIAAYARRIIEAARNGEPAGEYLVTKLIKEFGAKTYRAGKCELAARLASYLEGELRGGMARPIARPGPEEPSEGRARR